MVYPKIQANDGGRQMTDTFYGLNRALKIREGEWNEVLNLTSDHFPMLAVRKRRSLAETINGRVLAMLSKEKLAVLIGRTHESPAEIDLRYGENVVATWPTVSPLPDRMLSFGAYIIIPGLKAWYNTADGTSGSMEAVLTVTDTDITAQGMRNAYVLKLCPCDSEGNELRVLQNGIGDAERTETIKGNPTDYINAAGDCIVTGPEKIMERYNGTASQEDPEVWETMPHYLRFEAAGIDTVGIEVGDVIEIDGIPEGRPEGMYIEDWDPNGPDSGMVLTTYNSRVSKYDDNANGKHEVAYIGSGFIVLKDVFWTRRVTMNYAVAQNVSAGRRMPDMDYLVDAQNRLWGCKYGVVDGELVNEIYASALGDFKNWRLYDGTSMASWAASVGTDGPWTGAIAYQGRPLFFKERYVHKVYPSAYGGHQIVDVKIRGVQPGCSLSPVQIDGTVYYMSRDGVCAYDGSYPRIISDPILDTLCTAAAFGGSKQKLYCYICEADEADHTKQFSSLYVYDIKRGVWSKETFVGGAASNTEVEFAEHGESFFACVKNGAEATTKLWDLHGYEGTQETSVAWLAESGLIGYADAEQKYMSRLDLRLILPAGSTMGVQIEYDSSRTWETQAQLSGGGTGSVMIPVRPRRCDHFRIRLAGLGDMQLYSLQKTYQRGSDAV